MNYGMMPRGKIPPFGKNLHKIQQQGFRPANNIFLVAGATAWNVGKGLLLNFPDETLVLPPWQDAANFFWPVNECHVFIYEAGFTYSDYVDQIARSLFRDGAVRVDFYSPDISEITYYEKEI